MTVFRFSKGKHRLDLTGKGAELFGGRWNSKGVAMLYTSQSRALAFAEIAIHLPLGIVPKGYFLLTIILPHPLSIQTLSETELPVDWRSNPHANSTQRIGDKFIMDGEKLILKVPSAVVPGDYNYLINPQHIQMKGVKIDRIEPFEFDSRLANRTLRGKNK